MFGMKKKEERPSSSDMNKTFVCTVDGPYEMYIENYGTLGDYHDDKIVLHAWKSTLIIEGERLLIEYFTDLEMKITGRIHSIHM